MKLKCFAERTHVNFLGQEKFHQSGKHLQPFFEKFSPWLRKR